MGYLLRYPVWGDAAGENLDPSPSCRSLELIAASLGLDPAVFAEHRIATLRDQLDGRRVGFEEAWRRYRQLAG